MAEQMADLTAMTAPLLADGVARHQAGDLAGAARRYRAVLAIDPAHTDALHLGGVAERHVGAPLAGLALIDRAARRRPGDPNIAQNRANARAQIVNLAIEAYRGEDFAALADATAALVASGAAADDPALGTELAALLNNAAYALNERADSAQGRRCIELAWRLKQSPQIHTLLLILRLAQQDYRAGWAPGLWASVARGAADWNGGEHPGRLVVTNRNGAGDLFQFMRFIPHARRRVGRLTLLLRREMATLVQGSPVLEGVEIRSDDPGEPGSVYCEVFSLPAAMGLDERHVPVDGPYIIPPADRVARWRRAIRQDDRPHIGVAWSHWAADDPRSPGYGFFHDLMLRHPDAVFVGIHASFGKHDLRGADFPENFRFFGPTDLPTTACILGSLDLMIAPCGGMAHLSGAMGLEVWAALRRHCDWRWRFYDGGYHWYPRTRLFHQPTEGDWPGLQARIDDALGAFLARPRPAPDCPVAPAPRPVE